MAAHMCNGERGVCSKHRQHADLVTVPVTAPKQSTFSSSDSDFTQMWQMDCGSRIRRSGLLPVVGSRDETVKEQVDSNRWIECRDRPAQVRSDSSDVRRDSFRERRQ